MSGTDDASALRERLLAAPTAEERFTAFYRDTYWLVVAFAERRLNNRETARDIAAETFRIAWARFAESWADGLGCATLGDAPGASHPAALGFLYATCRNLVGNEYRRRSRAEALRLRLHNQPAHGDADAAPTVEDHALLEAMLELREADREVLYLAYWEECGAARIGALLGCSESAAWARVSRARRALKTVLRKKGPHDA